MAALVLKFETKVRFSAGEFSAFYSVIKASENYYKNLANSGNDLSRKATEILYWRIILNIKKRIEIISTKKQDQFINHIDILLNDIETSTLINAVLPPMNSTYNDAIIYQVRNQCFKTAVNMVSTWFVGPAYKQLDETPKPLYRVLKNISITEAENRIETARNLQVNYKITSFITGKTGRESINYPDLHSALEDGSKLEPITLSIDGISIETIKQ